MKVKDLILGLCVLSLVACSVDEVTQVRESDSSISFKGMISTRASATTTNNLTEFTVWGWNGNVEFMDGVTAFWSGSVFTTSPLYFWPTGTVDFYALSPKAELVAVENGEEYAYLGGEINIDEDDEGGEHWTYTGNVARAKIAKDDIDIDVYVPGSHEEQIDLIYAVTKDQSSGSVPMNFRHALSQVVFKASNTNSELTINIRDVSVCSVYKHGTYSLPTVSTTYNLPTDDLGTGSIASTQGTWTTEEHKARFAGGVNAVTLEGETDPVVLTSNDGSLFLLPQTVDAWDPLSDAHDEGLGAYFRISCNISEDGAQLWPNANEDGYATLGDDGLYYAEIAIPCDIAWAEGYRYTYTFIFGDGAGYYPPDDPNYDLDGTPILNIITFKVSVDEFQNADSIDVSTETEGGDEEGSDDDDDYIEDIIPYLVDDDFIAYVLENFDLDGDGHVSSDEAAEVTVIECNTAKDFTGIEYFPNLESFTSYSAETIDLSQNKELSSVSFSAGPNSGYWAAPIVSLDLSSNTRLTTIQEHALYYCTSLQSITLPSTITAIEDRAFEGCEALTSIVLPDGLTSIGGYAFDSCFSLADVNFPDEIETIGNYAFDGCAMTSVVLPASLTSLGSYCFQNCTALLTLDYSKTSMTTTGVGICRYCSNLTSVTFPESLKTVDNLAFQSCRVLESITLPDQVTSIGNQAFSSCSSMKSVYSMPNLPPSLGTNSFQSINSECVLYVPAGFVASYTTSWGSHFASIVGI